MRVLSKRYLGIIFIIVSAFFFALMNLFVKLAGDLPTMQKAFFRNLVAAEVAFVLLMRKPSQFKTIKGNVYPLVMRSLAGTMGIILNFSAIDSMDIADASILNKLSPFFSIVFSVFLLKERPAKFEWIAVAVAFIGAEFVVKPSFSPEVIPAIGGVFGGMSAGLAYTFVRKAGEGGASRNLIVFFFSMFSCIVILPFMLAGYEHMTWQQTLYLLAAGASAAGGELFLQIEADMFDREIRKTAENEQSCLGAAITAAVGTGCYGSFEEACGRMVRYEDSVTVPRKENVKIYEEGYQRYLELYPNNREWFHKDAGRVSRRS